MIGNQIIMGLKDLFKKKAAEIAEEDKERKMRLERDIIMALRQVYDPEIPVSSLLFSHYSHHSHYSHNS